MSATLQNTVAGYVFFWFYYFWSIIFIFFFFYILMLMNQIQNKCKMLHNPWVMKSFAWNDFHRIFNAFNNVFEELSPLFARILQRWYIQMILTPRDTIKIQLYVQKFNFFGPHAFAIYPTNLKKLQGPCVTFQLSIPLWLCQSYEIKSPP